MPELPAWLVVVVVLLGLIGGAIFLSIGLDALRGTHQSENEPRCAGPDAANEKPKPQKANDPKR